MRDSENRRDRTGWKGIATVVGVAAFLGLGQKLLFSKDHGFYQYSGRVFFTDKSSGLRHTLDFSAIDHDSDGGIDEVAAALDYPRTHEEFLTGAANGLNYPSEEGIKYFVSDDFYDRFPREYAAFLPNEQSRPDHTFGFTGDVFLPSYDTERHGDNLANLSFKTSLAQLLKSQN